MAATGHGFNDIGLEPVHINTGSGYEHSTFSESTQSLLPQPCLKKVPKNDRSSSASANQLVTRKFHLSLFESLLHLASIAFTTVVLYLCGAGIYFQDITKPNINSILNAFQFVAALHGIIIAISMAAMAIYHLQYELCAAEGLPLGFVLSPFQLGSIQMLFQFRFWKAAFAKTNTVRTYTFGAGIFVLVVLQALLAPSSAILLVPQLEWWKVDQPFGGTKSFTYLNASHSYLWPSQIDGSIVPEDCNGTNLIDVPKKCPYADMVAITNWGSEYMNNFTPPNITASINANMVRYLGASNFDGKRGYSVVTTGMNHITRGLGDIWHYAVRHPRVTMRTYGRPKLSLSSQSYTQPIMRPLVQSQCAPAQDITDVADAYEVSFPTDLLVPSAGEIFSHQLSQTVNVSISQTYSPAVNFVDLSEAAGKPLLGAVIGMSFGNGRKLGFNRDNAVGLIACTIAPHWIPTNMSADPNTDNVAILDNPHPLLSLKSSELLDRAVPIAVNISYAHKVNTRLESLSINVLEHELRALSIVQSPKYEYDGSWGLRWPFVTATLLSMQLTDALARIKSRTPMMTFCEGCAAGGKSLLQDLSIQNSPYSGKAENMSADIFADSIKARSDLYTPLAWTVQRYGYGWGLNSPTEQFAATVISLHAVLVFAHLLIMLLRRWHLNSCDSLWSFAGMLNKSPSLEMLSSLAVGQVDDRVFEKTVAIREGVGGSEAVFTGNLDTKKLDPGGYYS